MPAAAPAAAGTGDTYIVQQGGTQSTYSRRGTGETYIVQQGGTEDTYTGTEVTDEKWQRPIIYICIYRALPLLVSK